MVQVGKKRESKEIINWHEMNDDDLGIKEGTHL